MFGPAELARIRCVCVFACPWPAEPLVWVWSWLGGRLVGPQNGACRERRRWVGRVQAMEIEILKRASAYFARENVHPN